MVPFHLKTMHSSVSDLRRSKLGEGREGLGGDLSRALWTARHYFPCADPDLVHRVKQNVLKLLALKKGICTKSHTYSIDRMVTERLSK